MTSINLPPPGAHGGDGPAIAAALGLDPQSVLDLSQNLNPFPPQFDELVSRHLDAIGHYPDARRAERMLAEVIGVDAERLILTNGGSEAIHIVATEIGGTVAREPEFGLHPRRPGVRGPIWRSNPHSPTGVLAGPRNRADVWDEAFFALATGAWSAGRPEMTVGSLTKTFACPGLRLGYVIAPEGFDPARLRQHQPHWSVSTLALAVLPDLLEHADLPGLAMQIAILRGELRRLFVDHGLTVRAGDAPWVLVSGTDLRTELAPYGIVVRDCTSFGMPGVFRVAVPNSEGLSRLAYALDQVG
ncbi:aminotransferase class I/II-fold pyridoxal phosphate-dependent enzyme [Ornithinimicrobium sp. INDO-MA30-4]|uniref:aminotransferase class I/II-fold pyridoxal phosphate-dependent enzyme n=1 Tax=Ornithinimicrobium sp. INDO-MA30-4 TaxID=2908651 RepID=UPI001F302338|nr:aminotransferase class I/II-fold pyridoxal phosphate-dependent enzyme [Ornithinimicrobium sp. INDO-MA30-4]UJH69973.1 aminotransferase class I/II-fold pyridoxal phosphate-dependent enzyme [Ornithinimicrobium sp. INDO-MA30-4]